MNIPCLLAIESAVEGCSVALWHGGRIVASAEDLRPHHQSRSLLPLIERALADSRLTYEQITHIAADIGPGSFTSIRVGLSTARALCLALQATGLGFSSLAILAEAARRQAGDAPLLTLLNAGKGECYSQLFFADRPPDPIALGSFRSAVDQAPPDARLVGYVPEPPVGRSVIPLRLPHADALAHLAARAPAALPLVPFYLRPPDAKPMDSFL